MLLIRLILGTFNTFESFATCALRIQDLGSLEAARFEYAINAITARCTGYSFINFRFAGSCTFNP